MDTPHPPAPTVHVIRRRATVTALPGREIWVVRCPYCALEHIHFGVPGYRETHCPWPYDAPSPGYVIADPDADGVEDQGVTA